MKLLLKCGYSLGDIVMLTAAVRDLHRSYPGRFLTDVRTSCAELWLHNPHLTPIADDDPHATVLDCWYPLIQQANTGKYHCLEGFVDFLNTRLQLRLQLSALRGDIHLSPQERAWFSQVHELTRRDLPFWLIDAGGKYDVTIKWWDPSRYQAVVDHFRDRIQFVQVGQLGHHHPRLDGVIDLRGQTSVRELVRLVYHAQGVLCPVTGLMHLAAAVPLKPGAGKYRPCVVVAGGREPRQWEAYPHHRFLDTIGALPCCAHGGCWKDRTFRLRDGDERDRPSHLCPHVADRLPLCMDLITAEQVIRSIESYSFPSLSPAQKIAARRAIRASRRNDFDHQPLNLHSAGMACDRQTATLRRPPEDAFHPAPLFTGRGIVICGGGPRYLPSAWVCIRLLRHLGCRLPIQLWHLGPGEITPRFAHLLRPLHASCVDAFKVRRKYPLRRLAGWQLKPFALLHCPFQEVLLLDADNAPVANPEYLFDAPEFQATGAVFWPDYNRGASPAGRKIWRSCGLRTPSEHEFESGQILVDKARCAPALRLALWFNAHSDFYYRHLHGDKETFHLAFRKLQQPYTLIPTPIHPLPATMCQHDFHGRRLFQHRNLDKWSLSRPNRRIPGFLLEAQCFSFLHQLRKIRCL